MLLRFQDDPGKRNLIEGLQKGVVLSSTDPQKRGRIKVFIQGIMDLGVSRDTTGVTVPVQPTFVETEPPKPDGSWDFTKQSKDADQKKFFRFYKGSNFTEKDLAKFPWCYPYRPGNMGTSGSNISYGVPPVGSEVVVLFPFEDPLFPMYAGAWDNPGLFTLYRGQTPAAKDQSDTELKAYYKELKDFFEAQLAWKKKYSMLMGPWDPHDLKKGTRPPGKKLAPPFDPDLVEMLGDFFFSDLSPTAYGSMDAGGFVVKTDAAKGSVFLYHRASKTSLTLDKHGYVDIQTRRMDINSRYELVPDDPKKEVLRDYGHREENVGCLVSPQVFLNDRPLVLGVGDTAFAVVWDSEHAQPDMIYVKEDSYMLGSLKLEPTMQIKGLGERFKAIKPGEVVYLQMSHSGNQGNVTSVELRWGKTWDVYPNVVKTKGGGKLGTGTYPIQLQTAERSYFLLAHGVEPDPKDTRPGYTIPGKVKIIQCCHNHLALGIQFMDDAIFEYPQLWIRPKL